MKQGLKSDGAWKVIFFAGAFLAAGFFAAVPVVFLGGKAMVFRDFVQKEKELEINKCYNENCLDTMARMPDGFVDLTVTSPPYDNLRTYNGYSFDFESVAKELYRVTKQGGVVVWVVGDATTKGSETGTSFKQALYFKEIGFNLHDTMIMKNVELCQAKQDTAKCLSICLFLVKVSQKQQT